MREVINLAFKAHATQLRKWGDLPLPYTVHLARVAQLVSWYYPQQTQMHRTAWLHDVLEDTDTSESKILEVAGSEVLSWVKGLTNMSMKHKGLPRADRKAMDRVHIKSQPWEVKVIKACDRLDNLRDVALADKKFKALYAQESLLLVEEALSDVVYDNPFLFHLLKKEIDQLQGRSTDILTWISSFKKED